MKVNEIFYSLQGEGVWTGTPAVFVRLSGCNQKCPFCDTAHQTHRDMTPDEIATAVEQYPADVVIITGGEPTLQIDEALLQALRRRPGRRIHIETNGSIALPDSILSQIDWVTCSPKDLPVALSIEHIDEVKLLYPTYADNIQHWQQAQSTHPSLTLSLQPCYVTGDAKATAANLRDCIQYVLQHPQWRLSLQTHRMLGIQ